MNVLIAGCGYLGRALGAVLTARGSRAWGICRSEPSLEKVRSAGFESLRADLTDPSTLDRLPSVDAVVACQAPARGESYASVYLEATRNLLRSIRPSGGTVPRFVLISSTSVYGPRHGEWVDADTPIDPALLDGDARTLWETERLVLTAAEEKRAEGMVLRLSGIYGPGRSRAESLRSGRVKAEPSGAFTNRIHRDDAVAAIVRLLEKGTAGEVYLATDDSPVTQTEFYGWLCAKLGIDFSSAGVPGAGTVHGVDLAAASKRCSNAKLKKLGWSPRFADYKEGYGALLA